MHTYTTEIWVELLLQNKKLVPLLQAAIFENEEGAGASLNSREDGFGVAPRDGNSNRLEEDHSGPTNCS